MMVLTCPDKKFCFNYDVILMQVTVLNSLQFLNCERDCIAKSVQAEIFCQRGPHFAMLLCNGRILMAIGGAVTTQTGYLPGALCNRDQNRFNSA